MIVKEVQIPESVLKAENMKYDNSNSGLDATDAQGAIDELKSKLDKETETVGKLTAENIAFDPSVNEEFSSENVQDAIAEALEDGKTYTYRKINELKGNTSYTNLKEIEDDISTINASKGAAGGLAELDAGGKVPSSQLPSFVDDVLEFSAKSSFPSTGETGKIYVDTSTNKTYRWSGSTYTEISESLAIGETSSTAYRGDRGKTAYEHSQSSHARTDATKTEQSSTNGNILINGEEKQVYSLPQASSSALGGVKVDTSLSSTSTNPVQNKVIYSEIDTLKKSVSDGKKAVADTITRNGVTTATDAEFATMATNIGTMANNQYSDGYNIGYSDGEHNGYNSGYNDGDSNGYSSGYENGVRDTKVGTALPEHVLEGETFTSENGVGLTGTAKKAPPNGKEWTDSYAYMKSFNTIANANGMWIAGAAGIYYSEDGKEWTQSNVTSGTFNTIANANGMWIASGTNVGFYYSEDGKTWTQSNITSGIVSNIANVNGMWVAAGGTGLYYSEDGKTWTKNNVTSITVYVIANSNGLWVINGYNKGLYYSEDGKTWTQSNVTKSLFNIIANADGIWVAGSYYSNDVYYSESA